MAEKTDTPKVHQHLLSDDERRKWTVVDIAVVSPTSVTALLQNNQEWCIDTFDCDENEYQRSKRICLQTNLKEPPLLLSYVHVENKLKHFVCTKTKLHLIDDESESIEKSVSLSAEPSALCVEDNKVYISSNETKTLMFFKLELPTDTSIINLKEISEHDSIAEFVVHSKNIYVCTKGGKVSSYKETGEKQHDYRNIKSENSKARGLAVFTPQGKECNLLLVTWNDNTLFIYSTKTSHDLLDIDLNVLGKIRVTTSCFLISSELNDVAVYNMKTVVDRTAFKMILVSGCSERDLSYLYDALLHDTTKVEALQPQILIKEKSLRTLVEMFDNSCTTNDNITAEKKKLKHEIDKIEKKKDDVTEELESTRSNLSRKEADLLDVKAKLDDTETESDELRIMKEEKEKKCGSLTKQLEAERKATEELKHEIDRSKKEKDDVTEELENTRSNLSRNEADLSDVKAKLDDAKTEIDELRRMNEEKEEKCDCLTKELQAERKTTEEGGITKETVAVSTENLKTDLKGLIDGIREDTLKLTKQKKDVTEELELTKSTLNKKEVDLSQIKVELDAAISKKMDLEKTVMKTEELYRIIQAKEREIQQLRTRLKKAQTEAENAKTQVAILQGRKQELQKYLSREQDKSEEFEKLLSNAYASSFEYNKKIAQLEDAHNRLKIEYDKAEKTEALLSELNENIKELDGMRTELASQQEKLNHNLQQEKRNVICETRARILAQIELENMKRERRRGLFDSQKEVKDNYTTNLRLNQAEKGKENMQHEKKQPANIKDSLLRQKQQMRNEIEAEKDKGEINKQVYRNLVAEMDTLKQTNEELKRCINKHNKCLEESRTLGQKEAFSEVTSALFLSDSLKFDTSQGHNCDPYWFDETGPAVNESMASGVITPTSEMDDWFSGLFSGNFDQIRPEFKVAVTVSSKGTKMLIPDTGVELYVPGGSLLSRQLIEINIIDFDNDKFDTLFSLNRNSSVAVRLLPNKAPLRCPARLRLPHCLRLKPNFQELKSHVRIYCSEHAPGQDAKWEHDPELRYELKEDCCIIFVKKFCCIRYDVFDEAIDATNVTVFTSGKQNGTSMELAVGYHVDLPGRRELLLTMNNDMKIFKAKPFEFVKESTDTLQVHLTTAVSRAQSYEKTTTEVNGKLSVNEAAAKIAELPLDRPKPLHLSDASHIEGNQHISTAMLKVSETVSNNGTTMRILDTGIKLDIPPNTFKGYRYIEMSVVPFGTLDEPISTFSSNSSVIVELLPNRATFSTPVRLSLPHCLKLKNGFSKRSVKVYLSHHEKDQEPFWEELPDAKYELKADHCVIYLTSFCWVKYEIDNKIVVAKRIKVYTATRGIGQNDQIAEVEVGYFIDMPGRAENLRENVDLKISQCKPLLFFKEGNLPLQIFHIKVLPMFWKYSTPERNPKIIPYKRIADSVDTSLPFVFENQDASEQKPFVMFRVSQGNEEVEINIRL